MTDRPHWTTLNLAALWLAVVTAENQRTGLISPPDVGAVSPLRLLLQATDDGVLDKPEVLEAAVVTERVAGTTWETLAALLRTTPDAVERRFAPVERSFRLAEAFPGVLDGDVACSVSGAAVLRFPDASRRWLATALGRRGVVEPCLAVDDATWRRHEAEAVEVMARALDAGELPPEVDLLTARFDLEHRRVALLVAATDGAPEPSRRIVEAVDRGVRACDELSAWVQRRADGAPVVA